MGDTNDLLQGQIIRCRFTLPEGLKELMSDISREVLRAQPEDLYYFITDYLAAMLVSRDNLNIAAQVCDHVFECHCEPELYTELQDMGLDEAEAKEAHAVIMKYFSKPKVGEGSLLAVLLKKTSIVENMIPAVVNSVRMAYLRYQRSKVTKYEMSSESEDDEISRAAAHTLNIYRQTNPALEEYNEMATKIQAAYRAYCVRREIIQKHDPDNSGRSSPYSNITRDTELDLTCSLHQARVSTVSSISLAGSLYPLPSYIPYNANDTDILTQLNELPEREHINIDYTSFSPRKKYEQKKNKNITFGHSTKEEKSNVIQDKPYFDETEESNVIHYKSSLADASHDKSSFEEKEDNNITFDKSSLEETDDTTITNHKSSFDKTGDEPSPGNEEIFNKGGAGLRDSDTDSITEDIIVEHTENANFEELEFDDSYHDIAKEDDTESVASESTSEN